MKTVGWVDGFDFEFDQNTYKGIGKGDSRVIVFRPSAGIFNQEKYINLRYCPISIELEICSNFLIL